MKTVNPTLKNYKVIDRATGETILNAKIFCTVNNSVQCRTMKEYKGHIYRLKYFDGCFYPYLVQVS